MSGRQLSAAVGVVLLSMPLRQTPLLAELGGAGERSSEKLGYMGREGRSWICLKAGGTKKGVPNFCFVVEEIYLN